MRTRIGLAIVLVALAGCGGSGSTDDAGARPDAGARDAGSMDASVVIDAMAIDSGDTIDAGDTDSGRTADAGTDAAPPDAAPPDAGSGAFDVRVLADASCSDLSFDPPSITVPAGTSFTVRWINATGCTPIDIDKGGTVPIVIGLEPGTSYHDTVREWCGSFTGTFFFRAYYAPSFPYYLDVDCGA